MKTEKISLRAGRLDVALAEALGLSRATARKLIESGIILDGKKTDKASLKVSDGDHVIEYEPLPEPESDIVPNPDIKVKIVYEDADLMVIDKPRGLVVHTAPGHDHDTLVNYLASRSDDFEFDEDEMRGGRPGIVHRLDKDTSGLLVVAKTPKAEKGLQEQIRGHEVNRIYLAIVWGIAQEDRFTCDIPLKKPNHTIRKAMPAADGNRAVTHFTKLAATTQNSLLKCELETGRTHQIRAHLAYIGLPIVGDPLYCPKKSPEYSEGQLLHAYRLEFVHPTTGKKMSFEATPDRYFSDALKQLFPGYKLPKLEKM